MSKHASSKASLSLPVAKAKRSQFSISTARSTLEAYEKAQGTFQAPIAIEKIAVWTGFQVVFLSQVPHDFSALVSLNDKLIGINARHHHHRQRFSIGHELGHILLKHPPESRCSAKEVALFNAEADLCASELLIPKQLIDEHIRKTQNPVELAKMFDVSPEAMSRRIEFHKKG